MGNLSREGKCLPKLIYHFIQQIISKFGEIGRIAHLLTAVLTVKKKETAISGIK